MVRTAAGGHDRGDGAHDPSPRGAGVGQRAGRTDRGAESESAPAFVAITLDMDHWLRSLSVMWLTLVVFAATALELALAHGPVIRVLPGEVGTSRVAEQHLEATLAPAPQQSIDAIKALVDRTRVLGTTPLPFLPPGT